MSNEPVSKLDQHLQKYVKQQNTQKFCSCGRVMDYSFTAGVYTCPGCGYSERDLYGKLRYLQEVNPGITFVEAAECLGVSFRELNPYIKDGFIVNPLMPE